MTSFWMKHRVITDFEFRRPEVLAVLPAVYGNRTLMPPSLFRVGEESGIDAIVAHSI